MFPMITEDERAILKLAGLWWIYVESIKSEQKLKTRKKMRPVLKR
jgi:hypothetical protein